ncbi:MAG TPA: M57 family metalloprotease, partial [Longimicrobium sp.]|nr:M57 family metalloprotease [Longimicrobium sp.]
IAYWSGISGSYVKMVEGSPADITFGTACTSSSVAAFASFPSGGNPGSTVYVNTCFGYSTTNAQKVHNMVHELGHTIGFRHSNYVQMGETAGTDGANLVSGTPTSGNATGSVMNGGTALNSWAGFATSDVNATKTRYPLPSPVATTTDASGTVQVSWSSLVGALYYQVRRYEVYREINGYENWTHEYVNDTGWITVYGTSYTLGATWTGVSNCSWWDTYSNTTIDAWYEVRGVFANGTSAFPGYASANDLTAC